MLHTLMNIQELRHWKEADDAMQAGNFKRALNLFHVLPKHSKIQYNKAWISYKSGHYTQAIDLLTQTLALDKYLAIAHQLRSLCHYQLALQGHPHSYIDAITEASAVLDLIQDNKFIDYTQLDNPSKLHFSHILYNIALFYKLAHDMENSILTITRAFKLDKSLVIRNAYIKSEFSEPLDIPHSFSVSHAKIKNLEKRHVKLGKVIFNVRGSVQTPRMSHKSGGSLKEEEQVDALLLYYQVDVEN